MRSIITLLAVGLLAASSAAFSAERAQGISMHMLPKRAADLGKMKWGFVVSYAEHLKPEQAQPVLQTTTEFLAYVKKQDKPVQNNGVWIVVTNPAAYSKAETKLLEEIKTLSKSERIPLFIARGKDLPNEWRRYDNAP